MTVPPFAPLDAKAHTGNVTRLGPTRIARSVGVPASTRSNATLNVRFLPLYSRLPKSIRSSAASFVRLCDLHRCPRASR